jgi:hypothetical protein
MCPEILPDCAGNQQEVSTWKLFHHTELQEKWTKFLVDAGLCDISMTDSVLMGIRKTLPFKVFLYKQSSICTTF